MIEDGHVQQVFSATLVKVHQSLELLSMSPAWVAPGIGVAPSLQVPFPVTDLATHLHLL